VKLRVCPTTSKTFIADRAGSRLMIPLTSPSELVGIKSEPLDLRHADLTRICHACRYSWLMAPGVR
jgi:hypothetical protein